MYRLAVVVVVLTTHVKTTAYMYIVLKPGPSLPTYRFPKLRIPIITTKTRTFTRNTHQTEPNPNKITKET
jgi:hypothetical protein